MVDKAVAKIKTSKKKIKFDPSRGNSRNLTPESLLEEEPAPVHQIRRGEQTFVYSCFLVYSLHKKISIFHGSRQLVTKSGNSCDFNFFI